MINSISNKLQCFTSSHPPLTILSLGSAIIGLVYLKKQFSWIKAPVASTQKTDIVAKNGIKPLEMNFSVRSEAKNICCITFGTLSAAYAYLNPDHLNGFVAGAIFALSTFFVANRYFDTNIQKKMNESRPIFLGPHISEQYAEKIKTEYENLTKELPPANYCFDMWGAVRKTIDYKALSKNLQNKPDYNPALPTFFIVFRDSSKESVESDGSTNIQYWTEGVHGIAFFNIDSKTKNVVRGSGFEENKAKLEEAYNTFTKK